MTPKERNKLIDSLIDKFGIQFTKDIIQIVDDAMEERK